MWGALLGLISKFGAGTVAKGGGGALAKTGGGLGGAIAKGGAAKNPHQPTQMQSLGKSMSGMMGSSGGGGGGKGVQKMQAMESDSRNKAQVEQHLARGYNEYNPRPIFNPQQADKSMFIPTAEQHQLQPWQMRKIQNLGLGQLFGR